MLGIRLQHSSGAVAREVGIVHSWGRPRSSPENFGCGSCLNSCRDGEDGECGEHLTRWMCRDEERMIERDERDGEAICRGETLDLYMSSLPGTSDMVAEAKGLHCKHPSRRSFMWTTQGLWRSESMRISLVGQVYDRQGRTTTRLYVEGAFAHHSQLPIQRKCADNWSGKESKSDPSMRSNGSTEAGRMMACMKHASELIKMRSTAGIQRIPFG